MTRLVQGVGVNDADYPVRPRLSGESFCPFYKRWSDMLKRCYSVKSKETRPTYSECTVCDEWLTFSNFKAWMEKQDWEGKQLDKDILVEGNTVYSPESCIFVPMKVNNFFKGLKTNAVYFDVDRNKYRVSVNNVYVGRYDTEEKALLAYSEAKRLKIIELAYEFENPIRKILLDKVE